MKKSPVVIIETGDRYPTQPPFNPPVIYPEYPYGSSGVDESNTVYEGVRNLLRLLGMDKENYGKKQWNPFRGLINPGDRVLIKPNFVHSTHASRTTEGLESLIVPSSVLRPLVDYAFIATQGKGSIVIGDAPLDICNFYRLMDRIAMPQLVEFITRQGVPLEVVDFREPGDNISQEVREGEATALGDPRGYVTVDMGAESSLADFDSQEQNYRTVADTSIDPLDPYSQASGAPNQYHNKQRHVYRLPRTVLEANVIISVAKLKTHMKTGVTLCLKNAIGTIAGKKYIPHYRTGYPPDGDASPEPLPRSFVRKRKALVFLHEMPLVGEPIHRAISKMVNLFKIKDLVYKEYFDHGGWHGNDTLWRTIVDINRILIYADSQGKLHPQPQRRYLGMVDGIVGGDGNVPWTPSRGGAVCCSEALTRWRLILSLPG
ncbi:MAG: DUF362 domain-containing protein [Chloroflexi bacterium]|nr:DUF362 domain-containing protein [Chloroflexota bacterium]